MQIHSKQAIKEELAWFFLIIFIGLIIGYLTESIGLSFSLSMVIYLLLHFKQAWKVLNWLPHKSSSPVPSTHGIWGLFVQQAIKTEKKNQKHKERLSAIVKRFHEVLATMPDAIVILDEFGGIEWFNESAKHMLQMNQTDSIGQHITRCINNKKFSRYYNRKDFSHSINIKSPFDADISLNFRIAPYSEKKQLLSARDITRMRQLEGVRSLFVANVSHELRTPLTVISGYLELLSDNDKDPTLSPIYQQMSQQTDRMTTLLDDLLMLSNLENQQEAINETIYIASMINDIYREAQIFKGEQHYSIHCDIDDNLNIQGNAKEIHSAFSNLVTNALRYTPSGGEIKITWKRQQDTAQFSVQDNGIGIEQKHISRLTERFYRVDKGRSRNTGGTGLGLAIVKHVMLKHDAKLEITSEFGKGSCFTCIFPKERIVC